MMRLISIFFLIFLSSDLIPQEVCAADLYQEQIHPFMQKYCLGCHNKKEMRGELNLEGYAGESDVTRHFRRWSHIIEFIRDREMPPEDWKAQPTLREREKVISSIQAILLAEAKKYAGDPGVILPRRLSHTEYNLSVRDLTGVDIRPTKEFPVDPAGGEGFDNTGEALTMSPSLLKKYLSAAQHVSQHLMLKPNGISFAPSPVTSYNERKKLTEQAIIDFYASHEVELRDYLEAAWQYRYRQPGEKSLSIEAWAMRKHLSAKYLSLVWGTLNQLSGSSGYLQKIGQLWQKIPAPSESGGVPKELGELHSLIQFCQKHLGQPQEQLIRSNAGNWPIGHLDFRAKTALKRDQFRPEIFKSETVIQFDRFPKQNPKKTATPQTLYLRIDSLDEDNRQNFVLIQRPLFSKSGKPARNPNEAKRNEEISLREFLEQHAPEIARQLSFGKHPSGEKLDPDSLMLQVPALLEIPLSAELIKRLENKHLLLVCKLDSRQAKQSGVLVQHSNREKPADSPGNDAKLLMHPDGETAKALTESGDLFCRTFPNRFFYVDSRRGLAAGFHLVEGFFRDDRPLVEKVLNEKQTKELDQLWEELNFVTRSAETLLRGFVWFERAERHVLQDPRFDFVLSEDPRLVQPEMLERFEKVYLEKMGVKLIEGTLKPEKPDDKFQMIHGFFEEIRRGLVHHSKLTQQAEQRALNQLDALAARAYSRELHADEQTGLRQLYQLLRQQGQSVEEGMRGMLTAILMSPDFCYQFTEAPGPGKFSPLSDQTLANRLSYFLWSSLPDEELVQAAAGGKLQNPTELTAQTHRMLKDARVQSFAREFFGQWLRYRDYLSKDPINASTFPGYTEELRQAMFEEPTRLATHLIQHDRPITELLNSQTTFVNGVLAKHYGGEIEKRYREKMTAWENAHKLQGLPTENASEIWHEVEGLQQAGRGGLFGMGVILTKNSAGERTSPVKRGFWAVHHLLGQHFPPPPADVPELPANEKVATKTIRELLADHASHKQCAMCHTHFDSIGLTLEGFDPIGKLRTKDLAGRTIDNVAKLPDGTTAAGIPGLITYIENHRQHDFVRTFCRKFLGYALGRSVMLSDQPLLMEMEAALKQNEYRFSVLFETVVNSPQFRHQRGRDFIKSTSQQ